MSFQSSGLSVNNFLAEFNEHSKEKDRILDGIQSNCILKDSNWPDSQFAYLHPFIPGTSALLWTGGKGFKMQKSRASGLKNQAEAPL